MNDAARTILTNLVNDWNKYAAEVNKVTLVANEVAMITRKVIQEQLAHLKTQGVTAACDTPETLSLMNVPVVVDPLIEATYPNVKGSIPMRCAGAARSIIINPNLSISAGGTPITFEQLKRGIPDPFANNAAEFLRDAFLNILRSGGAQPAP